MITEKHPFKGVENYSQTPSCNSLETNENPQPEELDSRNEADTEPEAEEECMWELNLLVTSINKLNVKPPPMM